MTGLLAVAVVIAVGAVLIVTLTGDSTGSGTTSASDSGGIQGGKGKTVKIDIANFEFDPKAITARAGSKVAWTNQDSAAHTATATSGGAFDTGTLAQGKTGSATLSKPGTYAYMCTIHPFMKATLTVK